MAETILDTFAVQFLFKGDRRALDRWEQGFKNVNRQINNVARTATLAGGALTAALFGVGRTIVGFEQTMNNLQAVLNASSEDMERLRDQAMELGSSTAFSASQVGDAQTELALIFGDVERTTKALPDVLNLASAGQLEMGEAAKLVGNQMNAFGLTINDTQRITDVLARAASSGSTTVRELGPAFRQVAPLARIAGLSIEQTAAFIVALRDAGLQAEQAGTALRGVLARLTEVRPPQDFLDALETIGVRFEDLKALAQQGEYEEIFRRLGDAEIDAAASLAIFGTEAVSAGASLAESITKVEALTETYRNAESWAERMRVIQEQGLPGAIAAFRSALESLQLELGSAGLTNWLVAAADALRGFVLWLRDASGWVKTTMAIVLASGPVLLGLAAFLKLVSFALGGLIPALKFAGFFTRLFGLNALFAAVANSNLIVSLRVAAINLRAFNITMLFTSATARVLGRRLAMASLAVLRFATRAIVAGISGVIAFGVALWASMIPPLIAATAAVTAFTVALLANPVVLVIIAIIGAFVALGLVIYKFRRQIVGALKTALSWIKSNWPLLLGILLGPFGIAGAMIWKFRDQILGAFQDVWDWLRESPIFGPVIDGIQAIIDFVSELPGRVVGILKDIPGMVADAIRDIPGLGGAIKVFTGIADKIGLYAKGGIVPGPTGRPMLATVHGGEMVIPASARQVMLDMFEGFKLGAAGLPTPSPGAATIYRQSINNRPTVNMGDITINITTAPGADSGEIAEDVAQNIADAVDKAIGKTFRDIAHDFDGPIER